LQQKGKTILLTTHYMAEAEDLCDRIAIINHGKVIAMDTPAALRQRISPESVIEITVNLENVPLIESLVKSLDGKLRVESVASLTDQRFSLFTPEPELIMQALSPALGSRSIQGLQVRNQTMEDVYVAIIGDADRNA